MFYPVGRYTGLFVDKCSLCVVTRKKDALSFRTRREANAWVDEAPVRREWFTVVHLKEPKVKPKKRSKKLC